MDWNMIASAFGAITTLLLSYIINRQGKIQEKLDRHVDISFAEHSKLVSKEDCKDNRLNCENLKHRGVVCDIASVNNRLDGIYREINGHSHTNLPFDSLVIRKST